MTQCNYSNSTSPAKLEVVDNPQHVSTTGLCKPSTGRWLIDSLLNFQSTIENTKTFASSTRRIHVSRIRQLILFLEEQKREPPLEEFPEVVGEFITFATEILELKSTSISNLYKTFRLFANSANVPITPAGIKSSKVKRRTLSLEEEERFVESARSSKSVRNTVLSLLFLHTDVRLHECVHLQMSDLFLDENPESIRVNRCGRDQFIPLTNELVDALQQWFVERRVIPASADLPFVFLSQSGNNLTTSAIDSSLRKIGWRSQIDISVRVLVNTGRARRIAAQEQVTTRPGRRIQAGRLKLS